MKSGIATLQEHEIFEFTDTEFKHYITSSNKIAKSALKSSKFKEKLNSINPLQFSQTFTNSCTASGIMMYLYYNHFLNLDECTPSKEFEIYTRLWIKPGEIASPSKIISYLNSYGICVFGLALKNITAQTLKEEPDLKPLSDSFNKISAPVISKNQNWFVNHQDLFNNSYLLLVLTHGDGDLHTVFARHTSDGKFEIVDPSFAVMHTYDSFAHFVNKKSNFTGIAFWMPSRQVLTQHPYFEKHAATTLRSLLSKKPDASPVELKSIGNRSKRNKTTGLTSYSKYKKGSYSNHESDAPIPLDIDNGDLSALLMLKSVIELESTNHHKEQETVISSDTKDVKQTTGRHL
jgi:hypothetical protein